MVPATNACLLYGTAGTDGLLMAESGSWRLVFLAAGAMTALAATLAGSATRRISIRCANS